MTKMTQEQDVANFTWEEKVNYLKMRLPSIDKEIEVHKQYITNIQNKPSKSSKFIISIIRKKINNLVLGYEHKECWLHRLTCKSWEEPLEHKYTKYQDHNFLEYLE